MHLPVRLQLSNGKSRCDISGHRAWYNLALGELFARCTACSWPSSPHTPQRLAVRRGPRLGRRRHGGASEKCVNARPCTPSRSFQSPPESPIRVAIYDAYPCRLSASSVGHSCILCASRRVSSSFPQRRWDGSGAGCGWLWWSPSFSIPSVLPCWAARALALLRPRIHPLPTPPLPAPFQATHRPSVSLRMLGMLGAGRLPRLLGSRRRCSASEVPVIVDCGVTARKPGWMQLVVSLHR